MEEANAHLHEYIEQFNKSFGVEPAIDDPFWLDPPLNLDDILLTKFPRRADKNGCISFQSVLLYSPETTAFALRDVTVCINESGICALYQGTYYRLIPVGEVVQQAFGDTMSDTVVSIIHRYLFAFAKEISA